MIKRLFFGAALVGALSASALAQNANTGTGGGVGRASGNQTPPRTKPAPATTPTPATTQATQGATQTPARARTTRRGASPSADSAQARAVREAFDSLVDGWEQARSNRESLYSKVSDVKLDVRDVRVRTLGPTAAFVTCLWEQSQTAEGQPEHATGRLTIVYQKVGADWKIVHTHTSPDHPSPSNLLPSERTGDGEAARPPAKP
jgi:ketosteroid isomerase-like protein